MLIPATQPADSPVAEEGTERNRPTEPEKLGFDAQVQNLSGDAVGVPWSAGVPGVLRQASQSVGSFVV